MKTVVILLLIPSFALADFRYRGADASSVVEESMCIPELSGEGFLHVDEDVTGLSIVVYGDDGTTFATYDDASEIEDITTLGTYATPSASNVRVSPQGECTQMMFSDSVYANQEWVQIVVSDSQTTIMDFTRFVYLGFGDTSDMSDATTTALTSFGTATETNVDANETKLDAVKTQTDQLTFDANGVDSNVEGVNGIAVDGSGTAEDPWGPAE